MEKRAKSSLARGRKKGVCRARSGIKKRGIVFLHLLDDDVYLRAFPKASREVFLPLSRSRAARKTKRGKSKRGRERETNKWHVQRQKSEREKERERESLCTVDTTMPPKAVRSSGTTKERNVAICVRVLARLTQRAPSIFGRAFFGSREMARVLNARVWPDFERSDGINDAPG